MTLMQNSPAARTAGHVLDVRAGQTSTSGGSNETDVIELTAIPTGVSASKAATTHTPVGK